MEPQNKNIPLTPNNEGEHPDRRLPAEELPDTHLPEMDLPNVVRSEKFQPTSEDTDLMNSRESHDHRAFLWRTCMSQWRTIMLFVIPVMFSPIFLFWDDAEKPDAGRMAYCALLMASFWILELVPLAITGILPVFLFPTLGVLSAKKTCGAYFNEVQFIIMGGLIIAIAVEKSRVHERIALSVLMLLGTKPRWIMLGFMLVTAFLSMFLSNTATTAMMMPIANAIVEEMRRNKKGGKGGADAEDPDVGEQGDSSTNDVSKASNGQSFVMDDIPALRPKRCTHSMLADGCTLHGDDGGGGGDASDGGGSSSAGNRERRQSRRGEGGGERRQEKGGEIGNYEEDSKDGDDLVSGHDDDDDDDDGVIRTGPVDKMLLLCVSYSAQLGGTGLLTGCTPNLVTLAYMEKRFPGSNMNFVNWSGFAFPTMLLVVLYGWVWLQMCFLGWRSIFCCGDGGGGEENSAVRALIRRKYRALGKLRFNEVAVLSLFFILFLLWFSRDPGFAPGYAVYFKSGFMSDAVPAILICALLFVIPSEIPVFSNPFHPDRGRHRRRVPRLLDWDTVHVKMPWCIVLIMGGGLAMAEGMTETGLSSWLGERFSVFSNVPVWALPFIIGGVVAVTTDLASVMASCQIYTPVMADLALSLRLNPYLTLLPTTMAASFAFMLPVATPPAAIAFSYGKIRIIDMCKAGMMMNVLGVLVVGLAVNTLGWAIFDLGTFPAWAQAALDAGVSAGDTDVVATSNADNATTILGF